MNPKILLVEDEPTLSILLSDRLEREGYSVVATDDGNTALQTVLGGGSFDAVVLDVMLPGRNGFEVCRELRSKGSNVPILMLTARGEVRDRVNGLRTGADDYLTKPFDTSELLARIEALIRRSKRAIPHSESYQFADIEVNTGRREVSRDGELITLSAKEYQLLCYLLERPGLVVSRDELLQQVWGYRAATNTRTVDVHLAQLRSKLEHDPKQPRHLLTVHGSGYKFVKDA